MSLYSDLNEVLTPYANKINELGEENDRIKADLGNLSNLETESKTDLVSAINEAAQSGGAGLSSAAKSALLACFRNVAWVDGTGTYYSELENALAGIKSISAVFTQGNNVISSTDELDDLRQFLTVKEILPDDSERTISGYELSGNLASDVSTITVQYKGKKAYVTVNVSQLPSGYSAKNYVLADGTQYITTSIPETALDGCWTRYKATRTGEEDRAGHMFSSANYYTPYLFIYGTNASLKRLAGTRFGNGVDANNRFAWSTNTEYVIESFKNGDSIKVNENVIISISAGASMSATNYMSIFTVTPYASDTKWRHRGRLYYLKVVNSSGRKVYDFIPCVNSNNVVGLYDLVNDVFYPPTIGTLVAG